MKEDGDARIMGTGKRLAPEEMRAMDPRLEEKTIVLMGASYTRAWNIKEIGGRRVINKGVDGNQSFEMLARFEEDVIRQKPEMVIIWGFINDIHRCGRDEIHPTLARAKESIKEMVRLAKDNGIIPALATEVTIRGKRSISALLTGWVGAILKKESYQDYVNGHVLKMNEWIKDFTKEQNLVVLDFQPLISDAGGARKKEYATDDGTHISPAGYERLTAHTLEILGKSAKWKKS